MPQPQKGTVRRWGTRAAVGLSLASILSLAPRPAQGGDAAPGLLVMGDSHVQGLGPQLSRTLEPRVNRFGYEARPGWSTARFRRRGQLRRLLRSNRRPEVVVVSLGGNDVVPSRAAYVRVLEDAVTRLRSAGARELIWLGPPTAEAAARTTRARHERNAEWQREVLPSLGVRWIDSRPFTRRHHIHDGIHFTVEGYRGWAERVLPTIVDAVDAQRNDSVSGGAPDGLTRRLGPAAGPAAASGARHGERDALREALAVRTRD